VTRLPPPTLPRWRARHQRQRPPAPRRRKARTACPDRYRQATARWPPAEHSSPT